MADPRLSVLLTPAWPTLLKRVEQAVARHDALKVVAEMVLRPPSLLAAMAADALGAMGEDVLAADRLRVYLHTAWPYASVVGQAESLGRELQDPRRLEAALGIGEAAGTSGFAAQQPYALGVLDPGVLVLVAVAAIRVAPAGYGMIFLRTVHGLALSASAAETLGRLDPRLPEEEAMSAVLQTLAVLEGVGSALKSSLLQPYAIDPVERGRWRCLGRLLGHELLEREAITAPPQGPDEPGLWDGAISYPIERVRNLPVPAPRAVVLEGRPPPLRSLSAQTRMQVVFASSGLPPIPAQAEPVDGSNGSTLLVGVPEGARSGWIGFSDDDLIDRANGHRDEVVSWLTQLDGEECLRGRHIPAERIPRLGFRDPVHEDGQVSTPPRIGTNHWVDETLAIEAVIVSQAGAAALREGGPLDVEVVLAAPAPGARASLRLGGDLVGPVPVDGDRATLSIPAADVHDGMTFTAVVSAGKFPGGVSIEREVGPLEVAASRPVTIVLFLTAVAPAGGQPRRILPEQARRALDVLERKLDLRIADVELPWADDLLAGVGSPLTSTDDPRVVAIQEELARRALLTPGLEHALWLALLPGPGALQALAQAAAARGVAVATLAGLPALLTAFLERPVPAAPTPRLRLLGVLRAGGDRRPDVVDLDWVQEETRAANHGPPVEVGLTAVSLDGQGREIGSTAIRAISRSRPAAIAALVPISAQVAAVELRQKDRALRRIARTAGRPALGEVQLVEPDSGEPTLRWRYSHSQGALPRLVVALAQDDLTTPIEPLDPCSPSAPFKLSRYGRADDLVVLANDGWNGAREGARRPLDNQSPVVLRRLEDGRFWADVPDGWQVSWSLDGVFQGTGLTLALDRRGAATGRLLEIAAEHDGARVVDSRPLGGLG